MDGTYLTNNEKWLKNQIEFKNWKIQYLKWKAIRCDNHKLKIKKNKMSVNLQINQYTLSTQKRGKKLLKNDCRDTISMIEEKEANK